MDRDPPQIRGSHVPVLEAPLRLGGQLADDLCRGLHLSDPAKVVAEPAGAAAIAAWLRCRKRLEPPVAAIVSGGNANPDFLSDVLRA